METPAPPQPLCIRAAVQPFLDRLILDDLNKRYKAAWRQHALMRRSAHERHLTSMLQGIERSKMILEDMEMRRRNLLETRAVRELTGDTTVMYELPPARENALNLAILSSQQDVARRIRNFQVHERLKKSTYERRDRKIQQHKSMLDKAQKMLDKATAMVQKCKKTERKLKLETVLDLPLQHRKELLPELYPTQYQTTNPYAETRYTSNISMG